jgi:hypothetical protein
MAKIEISILKSVNGLKFGSDADSVHKTFGNRFKNYEDKELSASSMDFLMKTAKEFAEMTGRPLSDFTKYLDESSEFDVDFRDFYSFASIDYDERKRFAAIEIYSDKNTKLIVDGIDCSSFDLETLLSLADDFVVEENNTSYTSYSKQIGIWCPDGDDRVECVLFGEEGYYQQ